LKSEFSTSVSLTVHWDGKLMEDLTSKENVDHLPVLISGAGVEQLLGVPKLASGTGEAQAAAVITCLQDWGVVDRASAMCFDTTASNTGIHSGACTLIQKKTREKSVVPRLSPPCNAGDHWCGILSDHRRV
jgi:hypothetical protein